MKATLSLKIIQEKVKTCKKCDLCDTRKNAVPGRGNQNADIIFIGEAPGKMKIYMVSHLSVLQEKNLMMH